MPSIAPKSFPDFCTHICTGSSRHQVTRSSSGGQSCYFLVTNYKLLAFPQTSGMLGNVRFAARISERSLSRSLESSCQILKSKRWGSQRCTWQGCSHPCHASFERENKMHKQSYEPFASFAGIVIFTCGLCRYGCEGEAKYPSDKHHGSHAKSVVRFGQRKMSHFGWFFLSLSEFLSCSTNRKVCWARACELGLGNTR